MSSGAIYRERARQAVEHAERHTAMAMSGGYGEAGHHRATADAYRDLALALTKLAVMTDGGGE